ncbi:MAG: L-threonylcarbamoyladenylate synthase [Polyangiaceae bacterium]
MPPVIEIPAHSSDPRLLVVAAEVLRRGGLVAFPTETVYGLGALAFDERAVHRIFVVKGRPHSHPLIAHVLDEARAMALAAEWPAVASRLIRAFWPGPLTVVVRRAPHVPAVVTGGGDSIAIRAPAHPVARALLTAVDGPVVAPSANRYQSLSPTTAFHVVRQLGETVDLVIDGGACETGIESTVIDLRGRRPRVLRPGALSLAQLRSIAPDLEVAPGLAAVDEDRASPGMDPRHYAPRARLVLAQSSQAWSVARSLAVPPAPVGLVLRYARDDDGEHSAQASRAGDVLVRILGDEPRAYARVLYRTLYELDDAGVTAIVVGRVPASEAWWAVADRLLRATGSAPSRQ